jgi:hypothetical protein
LFRIPRSFSSIIGSTITLRGKYAGTLPYSVDAFINSLPDSYFVFASTVIEKSLFILTFANEYFSSYKEVTSTYFVTRQN